VSLCVCVCAFLYVSVSVYLYVCVCVCVCIGRGGSTGVKHDAVGAGTNSQKSTRCEFDYVMSLYS